jgi:quercetin dioxygenase-like cupin family protein
MKEDLSAGSFGGFRVLRMSTHASSELTGGAFEVIEDVRNEGEGPAPHVHHQTDEAFYVLEGLFTFIKDDQEIEAGQGGFVFIPHGTRHCYRARSAGARLLILVVPAGLEVFLKELDRLLPPACPVRKRWSPLPASMTRLRSASVSH